MKIIEGDIFETDCQVITNPVNCVGVMGRGLAKEFSVRFPEIIPPYQSLCTTGKLILGQPHLMKITTPWILLFPTKNHWREKSRESEIIKGLDCVAQKIEEWEITSIAFPLLGGGLGGIEAERSLQLIRKRTEAWDIDVTIVRNPTK